MTRIVLFVATLLLTFSLTAQNGSDDPVLFSIGDTPVHLSEFNYIYTKTNGDKADFSKKSLEEYLDLYVKFKLKVQRAKDMKLDTIPSLMQELAGYRRQLADSYLIDREVTEKLVQEAYNRSQEDVDISHILVKVAPNAVPKDTLAAYEKIMSAKQTIEKGERFGNAAVEFSEDQSAAKNSGRIGYVTPLFPNGYYNLETAAYTRAVNKVHGPIRTSAGYHLLKVHNRRPARGEMEISHILVRNDKHENDPIKARKVIDEIYQKLEDGGDWNAVTKENSEDKLTAPKDGYIGFFGINRFEKAFEDAAFGLENDGDYSKPIATSIGWHIIRRHKRKNAEPFNIAKARLENKVKKDARYELAKKAMIERIKRDGNFQEVNTTLSNFTNSLDENFLTYKWKAPEEPSSEVLFSFGNEMKVTLGEFADYLQRASRKRMRMAKGTSMEQAVNDLYTDFVGENALKYEERQLEKKYPEFKSLMREYEEGILLFEATKMLVWDKASQDTVGLKKFYETVKDKYQWGERAVVSQYSLKDNAKHLIEQIKEMTKSTPREKVLAHFNTDEKDKILFVKEKTIERGRNDVLDAMTWKVGERSRTETSQRDKSLNFFKIEELLSPGQKTLKEARGYVVADYQDHLEKAWIEELRSDYKVKIHQKVLDGLIKS